MGVSDDIMREFEAIKEKRDSVVGSAAFNLQSDLVQASPVDTGELRQSWQPASPVTNGWEIRNIAPHALVIDGGRRVDPDGKTRGSEQLPYGYQPIIEEADRELTKQLKAIK